MISEELQRHLDVIREEYPQIMPLIKSVYEIPRNDQSSDFIPLINKKGFDEYCIWYNSQLATSIDKAHSNVIPFLPAFINRMLSSYFQNLSDCQLDDLNFLDGKVTPTHVTLHLVRCLYDSLIQLHTSQTLTINHCTLPRIVLKPLPPIPDILIKNSRITELVCGENRCIQIDQSAIENFKLFFHDDNCQTTVYISHSSIDTLFIDEPENYEWDIGEKVQICKIVIKQQLSCGTAWVDISQEPLDNVPASIHPLFSHLH